MSEATEQGAAGAGADAAVAAGAGQGASPADAAKAVDQGQQQGGPDAGKQSGAKEEAAKAKDAEPGKQQDAAAPIDYAKVISEVQMPEGIALDAAAAKLGGELFAKHKISPEAAKDLVAMYAQQQKAGADGNAKAFADQVSGWKASAEKDTTPEERGTAKDAALKVFGKDEVALLEHFGVTNRAGFIKAMAKIGKAIGDDGFVPGNAGGGSGGRDARSHFPNSKMNP
jgi:hypothetical protein